MPLSGIPFDYSGRMRLCGCFGKARRGKPIVTAVGRYVDKHADALARALAQIMARAASRIAERAAKSARVVAKSDDDEIRRIIAALEEEVGTMSTQMRDAMNAALLASFRRAGTIGVMQAGVAMSPSIVEQLDERAAEFAATRGGWLIKNLAGTTIENLRSTLARGVEEGMSADDLSEAVQAAGAFGEYRADMIAQTELAHAHVQGNVEGWRQAGEVVSKRWILGDLHDAEDICDECVDAGVVGIDDEFVPGVAWPPAHPMCRCDVLPILRGEDEA